MSQARTVFLLLPAFLLVGGVFLLPFLLLLVTGFWTQRPDSWIVEPTFTFENYARLFTDPYFVTAFARTIWLSVLATLACLLLGFPVARWIASGRPGKSLMALLMLMPLVAGALLQTLGLVNLLSLLGVVNGALKSVGLIDSSIRFLGTQLGVLIGLVQAFLPLMVLPLATVLAKLPVAVEEAAMSLGASRFSVWRRIILPLSMPGIIAGSVLVFCASLTSFVTPQVLGQGRVPTFATIAYQQAALVLDWPFASALAVALLVILGAALGLVSLLKHKVLARGVPA
ncbi:MAG: ABC transporter permease [Pseudomonadota bacterium]